MEFTQDTKPKMKNIMARIIIAPILVLFLFIACSVRSACYKIEKLVVKCPVLCIGGVLEPFEGPAALIVGQRAFLPYAVLLEIGQSGTSLALSSQERSRPSERQASNMFIILFVISEDLLSVQNKL